MIVSIRAKYSMQCGDLPEIYIFGSLGCLPSRMTRCPPRLKIRYNGHVPRFVFQKSTRLFFNLKSGFYEMVKKGDSVTMTIFYQSKQLQGVFQSQCNWRFSNQTKLQQSLANQSGFTHFSLWCENSDSVFLWACLNILLVQFKMNFI